ncbi:HAD family hydrolase [Nocardia farcinica]|uniref:HAD family hydrolase n=1 Tax=Nocardia TaxID=1817 RepID=UPI000BEF8733|nr:MULTISPECIES: HAD family hydrolase [Nocardia]MBF6069080.1 HAD family hydrolase [Nocardia farcinica]MBF6142715.1 HAD family hydrolase [Nocardia farcinica]MBF6188191.1 HAD family hydrolase [Nocardia farcinica]MBF6251295.1 HAD family hydrolase [Nocardia farcinica]MBF6255167.1 HAD family hydrolase [Nocardia farcinica]
MFQRRPRLQALVATDLDRTMIYSRNAFSTTAEIPTVCVEHLEGAPLSFMTTAAALRMQRLTEPAAVIPTTTRTIKQFTRIQLPGAPWRYAVTSNGGNILVDGVPDMRWRIDIDAKVRAGGATLSEVSAELRGRIDDSWVSKFRIADHLFCYLVVKPKAVPADFLAEWDRWCRDRGWTASQQGRKIYTMPQAVCKSVAVAEVRNRMLAAGELADTARTLAAGDGALDAEMLRAADRAIRPRHGELEQLNWTSPNLTVTKASGILAGEEIVDWFIEAARPAA